MSSSLVTLAVKYGVNAGPTEVHGKGYRGSIITSNAAAAVIIPVNPFIATPTPASSINKQYRHKNLPPQPPQLNNSTNTNTTTRVKAKAKGGPRPSKTGGKRKEPKNERHDSDIGADEGLLTSIDPLRQEPPSKLPEGPNINNTPEGQSKGGVKEQPLQRRRKQRKDPPQNASANVTLSGVPASESGNKRNPQQLDFRVNGSSKISPSSLRSQSLKVLKPSTKLDGFRGGVPGEPEKQQQPQPQPQPLVSTSNQVPPLSGSRVIAAKAATPARLRLPTLPARAHSKPTPTAKTPGKVLNSDGKPVADAAASRIHGSVQESRLSTAPLLSTSTPSRPQAPAMRSRLRPEAPVFIPAAAAAPRPPPLDSALSTKTSPQGQQKQPKSPQKTNSPSGPPPSTTPRHPSQPVSSYNTSRKSRLPPRENLSYNPFSDWRYMTDDVVLTPTIWGADPHTREGYLSPSFTRKATLRSSPHQFGSTVVDKNIHTARRSKARPGLGRGG